MKKKTNKTRLTKANVIKAYGLEKDIKPSDVSTETYSTKGRRYYVMYLNKDIKGFGKEGQSVVGTFKDFVQIEVDRKFKRKKKRK